MALARIARSLRRRWILIAVQLANVGGILFGFYYYLPQFGQTPVWLWPLVPDSPFAVLLMALALAYVIAGRSKPWLNLLGAGAMVKVGLWTAVVLAWFPEHFRFSLVPDLGCSTDPIFGCGNLNTYLFYLHLGMAAEALIVTDLLPDSRDVYLALGSAFVLADVVDYHWPVDYLDRGCPGVFPHTVPCDHHGWTFLVTALLSVGAVAALWWGGRRTREQPPSSG